MVCSLGPTIGIAHFIHRLLQPIYDQVALSTTFFKETDAVHATEIYANQGLLRPTTLFATFHINHLCSIALSTTVKDCLKDNGILITNQQANQALEHIFHECKSKKLSNKLTIRAQREYKTVQYIKRLIRQRSDIVIR